MPGLERRKDAVRRISDGYFGSGAHVLLRKTTVLIAIVLWTSGTTGETRDSNEHRRYRQSYARDDSQLGMASSLWNHPSTAWHRRNRSIEGGHCSFHGLFRMAAVVRGLHRACPGIHGRALGRFLHAPADSNSLRSNWCAHGVQTYDQRRGCDVGDVGVLFDRRDFPVIRLFLDPRAWLGLGGIERRCVGYSRSSAPVAMAGIRSVGNRTLCRNQFDFLWVGFQCASSQPAKNVGD